MFTIAMNIKLNVSCRQLHHLPPAQTKLEPCCIKKSPEYNISNVIFAETKYVKYRSRFYEFCLELLSWIAV